MGRPNTDNSLIWLGVTGTAFAVASMAVFDMSTILTDGAPKNHAVPGEWLQQVLRIAFLAISVGTIAKRRLPRTIPWRRAIASAQLVLACAVVGELLGTFASLGWTSDLTEVLGAADSLEWRLFRLGAMAAYAVPMLVLLAASEYKETPATQSNALLARIASTLVRWEPSLFTIGVLTLPGILIAAAFINIEIAWLSPIGADTTVAACVAAAIFARRRMDALSFAGWFLVCVSMTAGLIMGSYSFGGPIPTPDLIGDYNALPRSLLRGGHVMLMSIGIAGVAVAAARNTRGGSA